MRTRLKPSFELCLLLAVIVSIVDLLVFTTPVFAATRTWDGGGATNNWSEAANWSDNTAPVSGDIAVFNGTSTKNATIDTAFTITELDINAGYTGTITQSSNLTITGANADFVHNTTDGTFTWSSGTLTFGNNVGTVW